MAKTPENPVQPPEDTTWQSAFTDAAAGTQVPQAEPEAVQEEVEAEDAGDDWRTYASSLGYQVADEIQDPRALIDAIHNQNRQRMAEAWQQAQPVQPPQPQRAPEPEPQPEDYWKQHWKAPEFSEDWLQVLERDEDGNFISKTMSNGVPLAHPQIVQQANAWLNWYQQVPRKFFSDPYQQTYSVIREPIMNDVRQLVQETIRSEFESRKVQSTIEQFEQENLDKLYVKSPSGGIAYDVNNRPVMTPYGQQLAGAIQTLADSGVRDYQKMLDLARKMVPEPTVEAAPAKVNGAPANGKPVKKVPDPAAKKFLDTALQRAQHSPGYGGYETPSPGDADVMNEAELSNVFIQAAQRAKATA